MAWAALSALSHFFEHLGAECGEFLFGFGELSICIVLDWERMLHLAMLDIKLGARLDVDNLEVFGLGRPHL